jgi:hypothetical protein
MEVRFALRGPSIARLAAIQYWRVALLTVRVSNAANMNH